MKVRLNGTEYPLSTIHKVPLRDILVLQSELKSVGGINGITTWAQVLGMSDRLGGRSAAEVVADENYVLLTAITIWAARRATGEKIPFLDSLDFTFDDLEYIADEKLAPAATEDKRGKE